MHPQSPGQTLHETLHHSTQALADTDVFAYAQYLNIDLDRHPEVRTAALSPSLSPRPHPTSTPAKGLDRARQRLSLPEKQSLPLQCLSLVQPASPPPAPPPLNYLWTLNTP